jgi:uncharacterized protein YxjI
MIGCHWNKRDIRDNSTTDTVYVKGKTIIKRDTILIKDSVYYPVPYAVEVVKDSMQTDSTKFALCDSTRNYKNSIKDSSGTVTVETKVQGVMINQTINMEVFRDSVLRTDTIKETTTTPFKPTFALGATLQFDSIGYIKPAIGMLYVRKKASWSGSVNTNGRVTVGGYFNLTK